MLGERLDLISEVPTSNPVVPQVPGNQSSLGGSRRFVGIHFTCCDVYTRVYVNREETAYAGHCPRCSRKIILRIGPSGTSARFFTVS